MSAYRCVLVCLISMVCAASVYAQDDAAHASPVTASEQKEVVQALGKQLKANYVFADVAAKVAAAMHDRLDSGAYANDKTTDSFAKALTGDLHKFGNDRHFMVTYDPTFQPTPPGDRLSKTQMDDERKEADYYAGGFFKVERLPGNVGYLDLRGFLSSDFIPGAYDSAMTLLAGTDALILDLRQNGGGDPQSVATFLSYFFAAGDDRHLNDLYWRSNDRTQEFWTVPVQGPRYTKPVYVLISAATFSGGEECAYDFQTQKRATLVGQTTGGGANPGDMFPLGHGLLAFIPNGRAINPITKTNWEHVGVKPDVAVPAADAQKTAYVMILKALMPSTKDPGQLDERKHALELAEKGEEEKPVYTAPED
ncbi:interphotoreceptor retinoid-binding protein [Dyella mobilis]|nr:interphotoreceptor retinoid-binding protein [Dyella mobilis]